MNKITRVRNDWSDTDDAFLRSNLSHFSNQELARKLNRTVKSVEARIYSLGLNRKTLSRTRKGEKWLSVPEFPSYSVSNFGAVKNAKTGIELKFFLDGSDYLCVKLHNGAERKSFKVHRLVAMLFNPVDNAEQLTVNHKDLDKSNNRVDNLEWMTGEDNVKHAWESGVCASGEEHYNAIYSETFVRKVCELIANGKSNKEITSNLGIQDPHFVSSIRCRRKWKRVSEEFKW